MSDEEKNCCGIAEAFCGAFLWSVVKRFVGRGGWEAAEAGDREGGAEGSAREGSDVMLMS